MMFRCDVEHENVLAISMKREGFEELLRAYVKDIKSNRPIGEVKVKWNSDRSVMGERLVRSVPEIRIRGDMLQHFKNIWTLRVKDISGYVENQKWLIGTSDAESSWTPKESVNRTELAHVCSKLPAGVYYRVNTFELHLAHSHPREAILYLFGAFNPTHMGHVQALVESKRWLKTTGNYHVCAIRIAITSSSNLYEKFPNSDDLRIKFEHRRKLCKIACSDHPCFQIC
ncbi:uncharacterized protein LOC123560398 [Mercenaria mercenaria]|uniref:uncharacterized protein LOC123560398 n=1 Tax=Mercenaria mercenaria TaxID=6596 RepID=UPI00234F07FC|nr:uncharacterized protein LOC123560398 [Mercenaria mercenaria]